MKSKAKHIHRGQVLETVIKRSDLTIAQITKRAGYSRPSYYNHINNPQLPYEILEKYGKAIGYDFTENFPDMVKYISFADSKGSNLTLEQAIKERDQWRDKYLHLLERYNALMEEKLNLEKQKR